MSIIWSVIPEEIIFASSDYATCLGFTGDGQAQVNGQTKANYLGRDVILLRLSSGRGRIISLLSTDPADFLDTRFAPNGEINFPESGKLQ